MPFESSNDDVLQQLAIAESSAESLCVGILAMPRSRHYQQPLVESLHLVTDTPGTITTAITARKQSGPSRSLVKAPSLRDKFAQGWHT